MKEGFKETDTLNVFHIHNLLFFNLFIILKHMEKFDIWKRKLMEFVAIGDEQQQKTQKFIALTRGDINSGNREDRKTYNVITD